MGNCQHPRGCREWFHAAPGDDLFPRRLMFVQAVASPTPCVKEMGRFARRAGREAVAFVTLWLENTARRFPSNSERRAESTFRVLAFGFSPEKKLTVRAREKGNGRAQIASGQQKGGGGGGGWGRGADGARLLWKVFPSISCSSVRALPRVTNR